MRGDKPIRKAVSLVGGVVILPSLAAGDAFAAAEVRMLHAVPGGPPAHLSVSGDREVELAEARFGQASDYAETPAGRARLALVAGGKRLAGRAFQFEDGGRYTVVAAMTPGSDAPSLRVYRDGRAVAGMARLRVVAAAPEVTRAELALDGRPLGDLRVGEPAGYVERDPGNYRLAAVKPGTDDELAAMPSLSLAAGTASSAYMIGSAGERTRFALLQDAAAAPAAGPATGLGGLAGQGPNWLLALLAAAAAGTAGGLLYSRASTRGTRERG